MVMKKGGQAGLIGNRGSGKTRMAAEIIRQINPGYSRYMTAARLFLSLQETYGDKVSASSKAIIDKMIACPLLVIDEVSDQGHTPWRSEKLTQIVDERYSEERPTLLISALTITSLQQCLGEAIISRINETGGVIQTPLKDYRTT